MAERGGEQKVWDRLTLEFHLISDQKNELGDPLTMLAPTGGLWVTGGRSKTHLNNSTEAEPASRTLAAITLAPSSRFSNFRPIGILPTFTITRIVARMGSWISAISMALAMETGWHRGMFCASQDVAKKQIDRFRIIKVTISRFRKFIKIYDN